MSDSFTTDSGGDVAIIANGQRIAGWDTVQISRSVEAFPNHFVMTMTEPFPDDPTRLLVGPGSPCQIAIGETVVITGYVDRLTSSISAGRHDVELVGRGICEDLLDCSADLLGPSNPTHNGAMDGKDTLDLANQLCQSFKINTRSAVADRGPPVHIQIALGETPYEVIERVARFTGYLVYEDEQGVLVLDRVGTQQMASGFTQGVNVEAATAVLSVDERFTTITLVYTTIDQTTDGGPGVNQSNKRAVSKDEPFIATGRNRPRIVQSAQTDGSATFAQRMADWEMTRRIGRSQVVQLTTDTWRDSAGTLWTPNYLVPVNLPALKLVGGELVIGTVTFRKDLSGTHAELTLMPKEAFSIQPSVLTLFDRELGAGVPNANPAPPSTG